MLPERYQLVTHIVTCRFGCRARVSLAHSSRAPRALARHWFAAMARITQRQKVRDAAPGYLSSAVAGEAQP